ncbi:GNAT family N-acetyltransferase [Streptomyces varsoviensis]|uniref:GNAT family N-acetyltransferase n=1 Tax=Streptomyces varsoviensis TaxID=67373 RepID=UPI0004CB713A|nr:GNAT family N-acetyltransferase [Streptomyces varsoviensis]
MSLIRTACPTDDPALHALWRECFGAGAGAAPQLPALYALDPDRHRRTFVAVRADGTLDAVVVYVPRAIRDAQGTPVRVGGIGSVAARPEARGRGLVRALLAEAAELMRAESCAWSLLFTGVPGVYTGSGWQTFPTRLRAGALGSTPLARSPYKIRPARPADLPFLTQLSRSAAPLSTVRSEADWHTRLPAWYGPLRGWLVAEDPNTNRPVGWATAAHHEGAGKAEGAVDVREYAATGAGPLAALFAAIAGRARRAGLRWALLRGPEPGPAVLEALPHLMTGAEVRTEHVGMVRPLLAGPERVHAVPRAPGAVHWFGDSF